MSIPICIECNNPMDILEIRSIKMDAYKDANKQLMAPQLIDLAIYECKTCKEPKRSYKLIAREYNYLAANSNINHMGDF